MTSARTLWALGLAILMATGLSACDDASDRAAQDTASNSAPPAAARVSDFPRDGREWPATGGGYAEQRFSPLKDITTGNVSRLGLAWAGDLDSHRGIEADRKSTRLNSSH